MKKFLAPVVLALALTTGGAAFAAQADDGLHVSVYSEAPELTYDNAMTVASGQHWQAAEHGAQYASRATMADTRGQSTQAHEQSTPEGASEFQLQLPE
jgi:hypothetical protein